MTVRHERDGVDQRDGWRAFKERMRPAAIALPSLIVAAVLLAACGNEADANGGSAAGTGEPSSSHGSTPGASTGDTPLADKATDGSTSSAAASPEKTGIKTGQSSGEPVVLTDVRVREHKGFDRVVLEFSGTGTPGWAVEYVDKAVLEGSGRTVKLDGDSTLSISASNTSWPASDYYTGPTRLEGENGTPAVYVGGTFEGYTQVFTGIDGPRTTFRVRAFTEPSRLVVDIDDNVDNLVD